MRSLVCVRSTQIIIHPPRTRARALRSVSIIYQSVRALLLLFTLFLTTALPAQEVGNQQVEAIERMLAAKNYNRARAQSHALVSSGQEMQLPELEARGNYLLGRSLLENPEATAPERVNGIRALQRAAANFRSLRQREMVDSIVTQLELMVEREDELPELPTVGSMQEPLAPGHRNTGDEEVDASALNAIVDLQNKAIEELTDSQVRQLIALERSESQLNRLVMEAMNDSLMLVQQDMEIERRDRTTRLERTRRNFFIALTIAVLILLGLLALRYRTGLRYQKRLQHKNELIRREQQRSEELLLNILPKPIAKELKDSGKATAKRYEDVSVLFADFKGFSTLAHTLEPEALINLLDEAFRAFDEIVERHGLEKIKTIGDAYMCVAGLPEPQADHAARAVRCALDMQAYLADSPNFSARIGIHSGPVVAGVVGRDKFAFDIWGDTVNQAARLEVAGQPGRVAISAATRALLPDDQFTCTHDGVFEAKNIGPMERYFVARLQRSPIA